MTKDVAVQEVGALTREVTVQDLQQNFAEHLAEVRKGMTLRITEGSQVFAVMGPPHLIGRPTPSDLIFREAIGTWADFEPPPPIASDVDVVALLREDRDAR